MLLIGLSVSNRHIRFWSFSRKYMVSEKIALLSLLQLQFSVCFLHLATAKKVKFSIQQLSETHRTTWQQNKN